MPATPFLQIKPITIQSPSLSMQNRLNNLQFLPTQGVKTTGGFWDFLGNNFDGILNTASSIFNPQSSPPLMDGNTGIAGGDRYFLPNNITPEAQKLEAFPLSIVAILALLLLMFLIK